MVRVVLDPDAPVSWTPLVHALRAGGVVVLPTDTIYGFSARIDRPGALGRIAELKGRTEGEPFLVLVGRAEEVGAVSDRVPSPRLLDLVWPGPVTLLLPARRGLAAQVTGTRGTVAVRRPGDPLLLGILRGLGQPVVSTSVNRSGERPLLDPDAIARTFGHAIEALGDAGKIADPVPSTVVDLTRQPPRLVRPGRGVVDLEQLARLQAR